MARNEEGGPPGDIPGVDRNVVAGGEAPTMAGDDVPVDAGDVAGRSPLFVPCHVVE